MRFLFLLLTISSAVQVSCQHEPTVPRISPSPSINNHPWPSDAEIDSVSRRMPVDPPCYICGSYLLTITRPNAVVKTPGIGPILCGDLYNSGLGFLFDPNLCAMLPFFGVPEICGCPKTRAPSPPPTIHKSSPGFPVCHLCGTDSTFVSQRATKILFRRQGTSSTTSTSTTCFALEQQGLQRSINATYCQSLKSLGVPKQCGCAPIPRTIANIFSAVHYPICNICGNVASSTKVVTNPNKPLKLTINGIGFGKISCLDVLYLGYTGKISPTQCKAFYSARIPEMFGCASRSVMLTT